MLPFTKMHGCGNDYVYVDCFDRPLPDNPPALARAMSDRHTGVGADGLILICPDDQADARMRMWNADGSPGEMCGNGIRCVAKYLYERRGLRKNELTVATDAGLRRLVLTIEEGHVTEVEVDMGRPILEAAAIPTTLAGNPPLDVPLSLDHPLAGDRLNVSAVSMGNPHCVLFVNELSDQAVHTLGPLIEHHPAFPQRTNVEFVQVVSPTAVNMRVWERGSGETQACGTGACAAHVAGVLTGRIARDATFQLPGGRLRLTWPESGEVRMIGPAVEVFRGEWELD